MEVNLKKILIGSVYGLGTAMAFSISPVLVRIGMRDGHSAEIALAVGMCAAVLTYASILLIIDRDSLGLRRIREFRPVLWEGAAALAIVIGTWQRYIALDLVPLGVVSALGRVNILVILLLTRKEVSLRVWAGGGLIIAGTLLLGL